MFNIYLTMFNDIKVTGNKINARNMKNYK